MILYVNACVREQSRTNRIAAELLKKLGGSYREVKLAEAEISPLTSERLQKRMELIERKDYSDKSFDLAKQFAAADTIVISAPFWDATFPSILKVYLENIYVLGIVTEYGEGGKIHGLCKADKLYYVTTSGGPYVPDYSYNYVKALAENCFGIKETSLIKAEMLDVQGYDAEEIVKRTINSL